MLLVAILAAVLAFAAGAALVRWQSRGDVAFIGREKQLTIDFLTRDRDTQRERIRQLEHTLDEARAQALNLTPPALRDAALSAPGTAHQGYDADLARELNAIDDLEHRAEYEETIRQMRVEQPAISDKEIRLTLFP